LYEATTIYDIPEAVDISVLWIVDFSMIDNERKELIEIFALQAFYYIFKDGCRWYGVLIISPL